MAAAAEKPKLAFIAKLTVVSLLLPAVFSIGPVTLNASRIVFLILLPVLSIQLLAGRFGRLMPLDFLVFLFCCWLVMAITIHNTEVAITFAGMQAVTLLGGYLVARASIRSVADFQAFARFYALVVMCLLPFAALEAFTGKPILMDLMNDTLGYKAAKYASGDPRLGLHRARVLLSHPIHFGLFCSGALSFYVVGLANVESLAKRVVVGLAILGTVFFSVSSGPFLAALFQIALITYFYLFRKIRAQWALLLGGLASLFVLLEVVSSRPAVWAIADRLAFNSATAAIRRTLWNYGTEQVAMTPWLGVGYNPWNHPPFLSGSIDNYWLALAITLGLPASLFMLAAYFYTMIRAGRGKLERGTDAYNARVAITFVLVSLFLSLSAVAIWGQVLSMVYFLLGSGAFLLQRELTDVDTRAAPEPPPGRRRERRYTRFPNGPEDRAATPG